MDKIKKIFVVINPTTNNQYALERASKIAKRRKSEIIAHLCIYSDQETSDINDLKEVEFERYKAWLEKHLKPIRKMGIKVGSEIAWDEDWQAELGKAAKRVKPDLIVKASRRGPSPRKLKLLSSDWALFNSAVCPVMLVNADVKSTGKIRAASDINRNDKKYQKLMELVLDRSRSIAESRNAALHVVNAYIDQNDYVHVSDVAKKAGIPSKNAHVVGAQPEQAIVQVAKKINAEMVIIGISTKSKLKSRIFGYTSEWLLNNLPQDL